MRGAGSLGLLRVYQDAVECVHRAPEHQVTEQATIKHLVSSLLPCCSLSEFLSPQHQLRCSTQQRSLGCVCMCVRLCVCVGSHQEPSTLYSTAAAARLLLTGQCGVYLDMTGGGGDVTQIILYYCSAVHPPDTQGVRFVPVRFQSIAALSVFGCGCSLVFALHAIPRVTYNSSDSNNAMHA